MRVILPVAIVAAATFVPAVFAEHASIDLKVIHIEANGADGDSVSSSMDTDPPEGGLNKRPVAKVKAGEPLVLQFFFTNTYPHGVKKNVGVRYFIVREEKRGQKSVPRSKPTVVDGQFKMTFKPGCRVGSRVAFHIDEPGVYLLRVESVNTDSDHEHFSAIDIEVAKTP